MPRLRFFAYAWDDLLGDPLGELIDAKQKKVLVEWDGPGSGEFTISRYSDQMGMLGGGNYVRCWLDETPGDVVDPPTGDPFHGFFIQTGGDVQVSPDETGGELATRGGIGSLIYLTRSILRVIQHTANSYDIEKDDRWHWIDRKVGTILDDILAESKAHEQPIGTAADPYPALSWSWIGSTDSASNPFDEVDGDFALPIGMNVYEAVDALRKQGLSVQMTPDLELLAFQDYTHPDPGVEWNAGANVREVSEAEFRAWDAPSVLLLQGLRESGLSNFKAYRNTSIMGDVGVVEAFLSYPHAKTDAALAKAANVRFAQLLRARNRALTVGVTVGDGTQAADGHYVPFTDYFPGDNANFNLNDTSRADFLDAIIIEDGEAGAAQVAVQVGVERLEIGEAVAGEFG